MLRYAFRITEETIPLIVEMNGGRINIDVARHSYYVTHRSGFVSEFVGLAMTEQMFFNNWPNADRKALLQTVV